MRLIRWMMIGELTSSAPAAIAQGLRNQSAIRTFGSVYPPPPLRGSREENRSRRRPGAAADAALQAVVQELRQDRLQRLAGSHQQVIDAAAAATAAHLVEVFAQRLQVAVAQRPRVAEQVRQLLHPLEPGHAGEGERHLV